MGTRPVLSREMIANNPRMRMTVMHWKADSQFLAISSYHIMVHYVMSPDLNSVLLNFYRL